MNSEYPHAGKHLNKPIIRDIIPLVYPGEGYFTVNEFREMIVKYHEENGGKSWKAVEKDAPIRRVLQEYVEQQGWKRVKEGKAFSWGLPKRVKCHRLFGPQFSKVKRRFVVEIRLGEDVHEHSDIDETSLESDVGNIAHPDLIASTHLKGLQVIDPRTQTVSGVSRLTRTFDSNREVLGFHQSGNTPIPNAVSRLQQQVRDTSIPIRRIRRS